MDNMEFFNGAAILNEMHEQATGAKQIAPIDSASFTSVATKVLRNGYDPVLNAISQLVTRTIYSVRPYRARLANIFVTESAYGNHIRKISIADKPYQQDPAWTWPVTTNDAPETNPGTPVVGDGYSVDPWKINKPLVLQTNFYGEGHYDKDYTLFRDQLNSAMSGAAELANYTAMVVGNTSDMLEQAREHQARLTLLNLMGGLLAENDPDRVVHLLTEYNAVTGLSLTDETVMQPANYKPFRQWVYSRIASISAMMTERTEKYQTRITGYPIKRHTPYDRQRVYLYAPERFAMEAQVLADTYHDNYLRESNVETVNYWQSADTPDEIQVTAGYTNTSGVQTTASVTQDKIFGLICDAEALGVAEYDVWTGVTPMNPAGGYATYFFHGKFKSWTDNTEKAVIFLLD